MKVTVIGKEHVSGTSKKTGKPFSATVVHTSYKRNRVDGLAVEAVWLDDVTYPVESVKVGSVYDLDRDSRGFVCGFEPAR